METFGGARVVTDDELYRRAAAEGLGFEDEGDAFDYLADCELDGGAWPRCGCRKRCHACPEMRIIRSSDGRLARQEIDPRTDRPRPPEWARHKREALDFAREYRIAQGWFPNPFNELLEIMDMTAEANDADAH